MQTFLFLMWPTHLELQRHQPADRFNESCSHDQPVWSWCSHITLHKCCCVSDLFSFPLADCWGHMVSFSHPNYRYLVEGEKNTWNTPQCIASTDRIMQTLIFPCGIFFKVLIHSSLTQTRKSLSHKDICWQVYVSAAPSVCRRSWHLSITKM